MRERLRVSGRGWVAERIRKEREGGLGGSRRRVREDGSDDGGEIGDAPRVERQREGPVPEHKYRYL